MKNTSKNNLFNRIYYKTFRMYCKENKVENFHQLNIDFVKKFEHRKHIRKNTAKKVFKLYNDLNKQFYNIHIEMEKTINLDRKSTRLNSSHVAISYAVF